MNNYYLSLVGPLYGLYVRVKAPNKWVVRKWANQQIGPKIWCDVYTTEELAEYTVVTVGHKVVIPEDTPIEEDVIIEFDYIVERFPNMEPKLFFKI